MNHETILRDQPGEDFIVVAIIRSREEATAQQHLRHRIEAVLGPRYLHTLNSEGGQRLVRLIEEEHAARCRAEEAYQPDADIYRCVP